MTSATEWREVLAEVNQTGGCARPIRLWGVTLNRSTGELVESGILVPCKDRRAAVCPSCSRLYQADAWQLVAAGIRGGKGVSDGVIEHPQLFVTLTAPSFGAVHGGSRSGEPTRPCRPRRGEKVCTHGVSMSCEARHATGDQMLGEPLCAECFDYPGAVLWNAHVPRLWERTSAEVYSQTAKFGGVTIRKLRASVRLSYMKVVEFQRRGLVHLHLIIRADGEDGPSTPPPPWLDAGVLQKAVEAATARASVPVCPIDGTPLTRARWGQERDCRLLVPSREGDSTAIAAYVAKYATKTADGTPWLAHPIRSTGQLQRIAVRPHILTLVRMAWDLGQLRQLGSLRLQAHAHTLGYTGQFSSKSLRFSTTFGALRDARTLYVKGEQDGEPDYDGAWRYVGRGYRHPQTEEVVGSLFEAATRLPRPFHSTATTSSTSP